MPFAHPELFEPIFAAGVTRRRSCDGSGIEQRGRQPWPTSVCSDQLFDACGAEPVLDLPHGGVVGRAQPRTSSIAQLSERLLARQRVRVEVRKLHQYVWAGQRHPSRRRGSSLCGTVASEAMAPAAGGRSPDQPGRAQVLPAQAVAVAGVGRGCRTGRRP